MAKQKKEVNNISKIPVQNGNTYARSQALRHHKAHVEARQGGPLLKDAILGGQDGLVNVLGIVLGVATATHDMRIIFVSSLAATFAESISMGAVVYTSTKAAKEYYYAELEREKREIETVPDLEREEIKEIYYNKGFRGKQLDDIIKRVTSNKELWLDTMMTEELRMFPDEYENPLKKGIFVGIASTIGSLIPVIPFLLLSVQNAIYASVAVCAAILFGVGVLKAKWFELSWWKSGAEMALIGTVAALVGYVIGLLFGVTG
ncbi:VIT1/CCC1 transporter family protein [Candidatus Woesearchaeota archaeon]|nr:VIT1/CCC1 transporter family protein [Candidatus Woesearchaeota archaeon]